MGRCQRLTRALYRRRGRRSPTRTHGPEQRARADFEVLVDTCPMGIVVFDVRTGQPMTLNREAKRIMGTLRMPDAPWRSC